MAKTGLTNAEQLVTHFNPRSPVSEAYRQLRTNIQFSSLDKPLRTLLVTSTSPQEGKSTTLANLAVTVAQTGSSVLVVDCDLRRPTLQRIFGVRNDRGLTSMLLSDSLDVVPKLSTDVPGLSVLPSGPLPPNPAELLASRRMTEVIERLKNEAEMVIFDSPPVIAVTDAAVLASKLDGVLLVISAGKTKRDLAQRAKAMLDKVNARIIGVVLNNVKYDTSVHHYYARTGEEA